MDNYYIEEVFPCTICSSTEKTLNILTDELEGEGVVLHQALEFVTCLQVDTADIASQSLCLSCSGRLLDAYRFKNQALASYEALYESLTNGTHEVAFDEGEIHSNSDLIIDDTTTDSVSEETDILVAGCDTNTEIDMSTDAVTFLLQHHKMISKEKQTTLSGLSVNKRSFENVRPNRRMTNNYECKVCERKFPKKSNLIDHLRLHANLKKFICSYCDKSFVQIGNYRTHLRIHTKERPYSCSICQKSYNQSGSLKIHMRSHTQERNYVCTVCTKAFSSSSDLCKHKRVHDRSRHFKCEYCDKFFAQKVNLKTHKKKYHLEFID